MTNIKQVRAERERRERKALKARTATTYTQRCPQTGALQLVKVAPTGQVLLPGDAYYDEYLIG